MTAAISIGAFLLLKPLFQTGYINHTVSEASSSKSRAIPSHRDVPQPFPSLTAWLLPRPLGAGDSLVWGRKREGDSPYKSPYDSFHVYQLRPTVSAEAAVQKRFQRGSGFSTQVPRWFSRAAAPVRAAAAAAGQGTLRDVLVWRPLWLTVATGPRYAQR